MRFGIPLVVCLCLAGCGDASEADDLLSPSDARARAERRLSAALTVEDGLMLLRDPWLDFTIYAMPVGSPWMVECGLGLTLHVGPGALSGADAANTVSIPLVSINEMESDYCDGLIGPISGKIQSMTGDER